MAVHTFDSLARAGVLEIGDGYRAKNNELGGDGPIFLRSAYLQDNGFILADPERFISQQIERFGPKLSRVGDVVITTKGNSTGRIGRIRPAESGAVYSPHLSYWRSRSDQHIDQSFLYYWAASDEFRRQLAGMAHSTDMAPYLSLRDQLRIQISLPDIARQIEIGAVLSALDDKIELNRRMNETLEASARALFRDWFVDFGPTRAKAEGRPAYLAPDLWSLFPDRLGDDGVPEGWTFEPLVEVTNELRRGLSPAYLAEGGICVLNQKCVRDSSIVLAAARRHDPLRKSIAGRLIEAGDILVNSTGVGTLGRVAQMWRVTEPTIVDSHVTVVRANPARISPYILGTGLLQRQAEIEALGEGSTGQTELSRVQLGSLQILVPTADVQRAFDQLIQPLVAAASANQVESRTLAATRDALLPKLISGEIRVRDAEALAA